jgi:hypothetical protein
MHQTKEPPLILECAVVPGAASNNKQNIFLAFFPWILSSLTAIEHQLDRLFCFRGFMPTERSLTF